MKKQLSDWVKQHSAKDYKEFYRVLNYPGYTDEEDYQLIFYISEMKHGAYSNSARCRINAIESNRNQIPFHNSTIYDAEVNINYDTGVAILTDNVVDEKSRGKGIGSLGMTYIKDFCKAEKCICIDGFKRPVPNTEEEMIKLTHFYIKNGFEQLQNNEIRYIIEN